MAIINSYPTATPTGSDLIIGTDVSTTPTSTKTFTIDSINALATGTPASGTLNTIPIFTSAIAVGDSTIVRSGAGATSLYTFGGGTAISNTAITTTDLTTTGNTILGNAGADTLTVNAAATFTDNITMNGASKNLTLGVTNPIIFLDGTGTERLRIAGDITNNSIIQDSSAGDLMLFSNTELEIKSGISGENFAKFTKDGPIELYYDNSKKFETTTSGVLVTGSITTTGDVILPDNAKLEIGSAAGGDLQIYHDAANSYIDEQGTGDLFIKGSTNVYISTSGGGTMAQFTDSGSVFLNHSGSLRFSTSAIGVTAYGDVTTTGQFRVNALNAVPASASATGTLGEIRFTADHIYVCVAANTWKRVAIATF